MSEIFSPGDVVEMKSGGPKMTVTSVGDNWGQPGVWCEWFDSKAEPQKNVFSPTSLQKA